MIMMMARYVQCKYSTPVSETCDIEPDSVGSNASISIVVTDVACWLVDCILSARNHCVMGGYLAG